MSGIVSTGDSGFYLAFQLSRCGCPVEGDEAAAVSIAVCVSHVKMRM